MLGSSTVRTTASRIRIRLRTGELDLTGLYLVMRIPLLIWDQQPVSRIRNRKKVAMPRQENATLTEYLHQWNGGDRQAAARVIEEVYDELRNLAASYARKERPDHTLQATAIVHEAYLQLFGDSTPPWRNRSHFFGVAARIMRRILIDYARGHNAVKRGGQAQKLPLGRITDLPEAKAPEVVALDEALTSLAALEPRLVRIVEARYFGGMSVAETAEYVGASRATVIRDWRRAKAWLHAELTSQENGHAH